MEHFCVEVAKLEVVVALLLVLLLLVVMMMIVVMMMMMMMMMIRFCFFAAVAFAGFAFVLCFSSVVFCFVCFVFVEGVWPLLTHVILAAALESFWLKRFGSSFLAQEWISEWSCQESRTLAALGQQGAKVVSTQPGPLDGQRKKASSMASAGRVTNTAERPCTSSAQMRHAASTQHPAYP